MDIQGLPVFTVVSEPSAIQLEAAMALRYRVFVEEQRVPLALEQDGLDGEAAQVVVFDGETCVATGRLMPAGDDPAAAKVQRVAVDPAWRGRGVGRVVMQGLEARASELGRPRVLLASQISAVGFYERLGYRAFGELFMDAGIEHRWMERVLAAG